MMPAIPLDLITVPETNVRRTPASAAADDGLQRSINALGLLTPILLRPLGNDGYVVVAGRRRLAACRALGFAQIEAHIDRTLREDRDALAATAENMARAEMPPVDQWRAMAQLLDGGWTIPAAAAALGLDERHARKLAKLGSCHESVLAAIDAFGMPEARHLAIIASAPPEKQANAVQAAQRTGFQFDWYRVSGGCEVQRIPSSRAIFDIATSGVVFEEDLFAPADAAATTTDVAGFMAAQNAAIAERIEALRKAGRNGGIAKYAGYVVQIPKGYVDSGGDADKPKRNETVLFALATESFNFGELKTRVVKKAAAAKQEQPAPKAGERDDDPPSRAPSGGHVEPAEETPPPEPVTNVPFTRDGRLQIARAKTAAIAARLRETHATLPHDELLALLVLALGCSMVRISNHDHEGVGFADLAARLVPPAGVAAGLVASEAAACAAEAIARLAQWPTNTDIGDDAAEWIGHHIAAELSLPRFDTPQFLAEVTGDELRRIAFAAGLPNKGTVKALRAQLAGHLPDWRPCAFGAPGPKVEA